MMSMGILYMVWPPASVLDPRQLETSLAHTVHWRRSPVPTWDNHDPLTPPSRRRVTPTDFVIPASAGSRRNPSRKQKQTKTTRTSPANGVRQVKGEGVVYQYSIVVVLSPTILHGNRCGPFTLTARWLQSPRFPRHYKRPR